jgi:hypothetical protein
LNVRPSGLVIVSDDAGVGRGYYATSTAGSQARSGRQREKIPATGV